VSIFVSGNNIFTGTAGGVFRTGDSGAHWVKIDSGLTDEWVYCFTECGKAILAGTSNGYLCFQK
jgi:hypothetical protein